MQEGYNPLTLENHITADLYYDATYQTLGSVFPTTSNVQLDSEFAIIIFSLYLELAQAHPK